MRKYFYFVRHAESLSNKDPLFKGDDSLSDIGKAQAISLAQRFKKIDIDIIYTSQLLRAIETGEEIKKVSNGKLEICEFFKERSGSISTNNEFISKENFENVKKRFVDAKDFLENQSCKKIVVVSHAIFLKSLFAYLMIRDSLNEEILESINKALNIDNTGVSKLIFDDEKKKWTIISLNDLAHLAE